MVISRPDPQLHGAVFDDLDCGIIVLGADRRIVGWNAWLAAASGLEAAACIGKAVDELFPQLGRGRLASAIREALESGASSVMSHALHSAVFPLKTRNGGELIHNVSIRPLGDGAPPRALIQITDITAASHREQILRERQNARYNAVVESAPDAIFTLDAEGLIQLANPAAAREFGYEPDELVGRPVSVLFGGQVEWEIAWRSIIAGKPLARPIDVMARRKDGSPSYLEVSASRWSSEPQLFVTAILRDVNERRAAEDALRTLNQTLEHRVAERTADRDRMWRLSSDVMLVARYDSTITAVNPAWLTLFGWRESDLIGRTLIEFVHPDDIPTTVMDDRRLEQGLKTYRFENRYRHRDGSYRWLSWTAVPEDGLIHAVGRDITDEKQRALALAQAEEQLRQAQKMEAVGHLTGGVAHDFNNLLQVVVGNLEILQRNLKSDSARLKRAVDNAMTGARRAAVLTQRLLAFSRRQPLAPRALDLNQLVHGMSDLLGRTLGETVRIETILADDVFRVEVDPNQLENAILNLAVNARDAMPPGGSLTIETGNAQLDGDYVETNADVTPGHYAVISVTDTGAGMDRETLTRVFEPFFTTKEVGKGTGLGLSMVYGFVKQSGGHVKIYSEVDQGTTVRIYLPKLMGETAEEIAADDLQEPPPGSRSETILVVEDDDDVRMYSVEILRELGYRVLEAHDSASALRLLERQDGRVDLLFSDIVLPGGVNGEQLAERARGVRPDLKVLFTTGYARNAIMRDGRLEPGVELITKPFTYAALAARIRAILDL
jgi:PAS domain S-box-containing protein